jgi:hypothetical protein
MWNQKEFESVYNRYKLSGLQVKDFCINEGIYTSKFYYWKKKLREQQLELEQPSGFVPIVFNSAQAPISNTVCENKPSAVNHLSFDNIIEIVYPNGVIVRIPQGADIKQIQSLILLTQSSHV